MAGNRDWEAGKFTRVKEAAKIFLKRFGPLLITGLAAVAEHHWLGHDGEPENNNVRNEPDEQRDRPSIRKLEREVKELKKSLASKVRDDEQIRGANLPPGPEEEILETRFIPQREAQAQEPYIRGRAWRDDRPEPRSYQPYQERPAAQTGQMPSQEPPVHFVEVQEREYRRPSYRQVSNRHLRRHRHSSVSNRSSRRNEFSDSEIHAGKVAVIAGAVETLHASGDGGDWTGRRGVRVGTTMAASYVASRSRDRDPDNFTLREVVIDVGTGLLVSRLVHGSSRRLGEAERAERRGRRWSHCY